MSTPINDGGPAFPNKDELGNMVTGMSLRAWLTGTILGGMAASLAAANSNTPRDLADAAVELADAAIAALEAKQ